MTISINPLSQYDKKTPAEIVGELEELASLDQLTENDIHKANAYLSQLGYRTLCFESYAPHRYHGFKLFQVD